MAKFTYSDGEGCETLFCRGYQFNKGAATEVDDPKCIKRFNDHPHFKLVDDEPAQSKPLGLKEHGNKSPAKK